MLLPGDILLTRNAGDEENNTSPGYWNHASIYTDEGVIEAQPAPNAVILSDKREFWNRYPRIRVYRVSPEVGIQAAVEAKKFLHSTYRKVASVFRFLRRTSRGENCVSVVRKAYRNVIGRDPKWTRPDDIDYDRSLSFVMEKNEL